MAAAPAIAQPTPGCAYKPEEINAYMELPFRSVDLSWRVLSKNTTSRQARVIPYARRQAYMKRLDFLFGPSGWSQTFGVSTVSNIQREKYIGNKSTLITTGKVLVTSTISINSMGTKSSTGEGWADDENGSTRAEAQAFRRACAEFGMGRYLRDLDKWVCMVPLDAKGFPICPHFSALPDWAIHPSDIDEATRFRAGQTRGTSQQRTSTSAANRSTSTQPLQNRNQNPPPRAVASFPPPARTGDKTTHASGAAPHAQAQANKDAIEVQLAILRTPEIKQRLSSYLEQLSQNLILSVVNGVSELHAVGRMKGNLVDDVFCNLNRAVDIINRIEDMEPMLPNDNTLPSILHDYSAKSLRELQSLADLKAVSRRVTTIFQAEQARQHGEAAA
jgi:hypothetical protein